MRQLAITILILMFGVAAPSAAQVYPGKQLEVYDANDELVGQLLSLGYLPFVAITTASGDSTGLSYFPGVSGNPTWAILDFYFQTTDCTGTAYTDYQPEVHALPGESGDFYAATSLGEVYRFSGSPQSVTSNSRRRNDGTCSVSSSTKSQQFAGTEVGTVSTAFPFYVKEVPASAPLLPLWAFGTIAAGIALSGGALAARRRHAN